MAVGPYDVLQAVRGSIRYADRAGTAPYDVPVSDFFGLPSTAQATGSRVAWDGGHRRWLAVEASWDCSNPALPRGYLDLAISDSTDPQWYWDIYTFDLGDSIAIAPALGTSTDKIVIGMGEDHLNPGSNCVTSMVVDGSSLLLVDWATILPLPSSLPDYQTSPDASQSPYRPALADPADSSTSTVFAISEAGGGSVQLTTINGSVASPAITTTDLTGAGVVSALVPPAPFGEGGNFRSTDGLTDLVRHGDHLWFVATTVCTPAGDVTQHDCVRVADLANPGPTLVQDFLIARSGYDTYAGGLGVGGDATLFAVFSQSNVATFISTYATYRAPGDAPASIHQPALIASGVTTFFGNEVGFVGLAPDPLDATAVWQGDQYAADVDDGWGSWISKLGHTPDTAAEGTVAVESGRPTVHTLRVHVGAVAAIGTQVLVSNVATTSGGQLSQAKSLPPSRDIQWDLADVSTGGSTSIGDHTVFVQFGDGAGAWGSVRSATVKYAGPPPVIRFAGPNRYGTAAAIAMGNYEAGIDTVFVATGLNFPDALAGAGAAGQIAAPIVLVQTDAIPIDTDTALKALAPKHIVILGGVGVVSSGVQAALAAYVGGNPTNVRRIAGPDRYGTAAAISAAYISSGISEVFIATGLNFPDALAGAAVAGHLGGPVLLTSTTTLPAATASELQRLHPHRITILGGTSVVSTAVESKLRAYTDDGGLFRIAGSNRYETAADIAFVYFDPGPPLVFVATGSNFPDALAGAAVAGWLGGPIILVPPTAIPASASDALTYLQPPEIDLLGGPGAVSDGVKTQLAGYIH